MTERQRWERREERRFALVFLLSLLGLYLLWYFTAGHQTSARLAALGGAISVLGVVVMARPVLRVGIFQYIANVVFEDVLAVDDSPERPVTKPSPESARSTRASDLINQNVMGPYLVAVGTIINGFSGLFS
jgi:hypothetical protein